jgi:hypothetical protein
MCTHLTVFRVSIFLPVCTARTVTGLDDTGTDIPTCAITTSGHVGRSADMSICLKSRSKSDGKEYRIF